jgi:hypothetical protein
MQQRGVAIGRSDASRTVPTVLAAIAVPAFAAMTIERTSAHDKGGDGNPQQMNGET